MEISPPKTKTSKLQLAIEEKDEKIDVDRNIPDDLPEQQTKVAKTSKKNDNSLLLSSICCLLYNPWKSVGLSSIKSIAFWNIEDNINTAFHMYIAVLGCKKDLEGDLTILRFPHCISD